MYKSAFPKILFTLSQNIEVRYPFFPGFRDLAVAALTGVELLINKQH